MSDAIAALFERTNIRNETPRQRNAQKNQEQPIADSAVTPSGVGEIAGRGFGAGIEGIRTDTDYLKGLLNTVTGDDQAAQINIQTAKAREARIADSLSGLETFEEFTANPTLEGFLNQTVKIGGQVAPYALTTVMSGGSSAVGTAIMKTGLSVSSRVAAKKIVKDSIKRTAAGEATPDEKEVAELAYQLAQKSVRGRMAESLSPSKGALVGQFAEEYGLMSGANFGENLEIDGLSDHEAAYRALAVAAPQALIGVAGERVIQNAIFKNLKGIAKQRGGDGSIIAKLGKEIAKATGKGSVGESIAETGQDALQVANVMQADDTFTAEDALLRLAESAFSGAVGGGAMSGGGRAVTGSLSSSAAVIAKAGQYIQDAREQGLNERYNREQYGVNGDGLTTTEPMSHMNAQMRALLDTDTERNAVWSAGNEPAYGAAAPVTDEKTKTTRPGAVRAVEVEGEVLYTAFVPGRGTILTRYEDVAKAVVDAEASDASLQIALGYSATKPKDASISIEARDRDGNVVWAEATNEAGVSAAYDAARKQTPEGGSQTRQTVEKALEERKKLLDKEQGPQVRNIDVPQDVQDAFVDEDIDPEDGFSNNLEEEFGRGVNEQGPVNYENIGNSETYSPGNGQIFQNTEALRDRFEAAFIDEYGQIDWTDPKFGSMSDALLKQSVQLKVQNPETDVFVDNNKDGSYSIMQGVPPEQDVYNQQPDALVDPDAPTVTQVGKTGKNRRANTLSQMLRGALTRATRSAFARKKKVKGSTDNNGWVPKDPSEIVTINGKPVNLVDLVKDGQRMVQEEEGVNFTEGGPETAARNGLYRMLGELISRGYEIKSGTTILDGPTLDQLVIDSRLYARAYSRFKKAQEAGDTTAVEPERSPLLQTVDTAAAITDSGSETMLSKSLRTTPIETAGKDAQYTATRIDGNDSGTMTFTGNKAEVQTFLEGRTDSAQYKIEKTQWDGVNSKEVKTEITEDQLAEERDVGLEERRDDEIGFDGRSEIDRMSDGNIDTTQENIYGRSDPGADAPKTRIFGLPANSFTKKLTDIARRSLRLKKPVSIFTADALIAATSADISRLFTDPKVASYVQSIAKDLKANPEGGGRYIGFGDAHIILVDTSVSKNELQTALTVAHELGHALFQEQQSLSLNNPILYNRIYAAFEAARDAKDAPSQYKNENGFEEWYADQVSTWAVKTATSERAKQAGTTNDPASRTSKKIVTAGVVAFHFKKIARTLAAFHKQLGSELQKRFGKKAYSADFDSYMDEVVRRNRVNSKFTAQQSGAKAATFKEKVLVRKMAEAANKNTKPGYVEAIQRQVVKIVSSEGFAPVYNMLFTADSRMRKIAGNKMADLFYGRAQDPNNQGKNKLGFIKTSTAAGNKWWNKLEKALGGDLKTEEVNRAFAEAFTDTPTAELEGKALAIRKWFEQLHDEYIDPSNTDIAKRDNYTPVALKLSEIHHRSDQFVALIMDSNPNQDLGEVQKAVQKLVDYEQSVLDGAPIVLNREVNPATSAEKALILTKNISPQALRDAGFVEEPEVATLKYLGNIIKRVEWNRNTKDDAGYSIYEEELAKLSPAAQKEAKMIVEKYLGYNTKPLPETWKNIQSALILMQIVAILPLAVLGSLPELAGPVIASKEFSAVAVGMKEIINTIKNPDEARRLARDIGVVSSQTSANVLMSAAEMEWMNDSARKLTDGFFRLIYLDQYTKFTREFAVNMGLKFLDEHSNPDTQNVDSKRYLEELGVVASDVKAWRDSGQDFTTPEGMKVEEALVRFVESSTLRPNAAERPVWASDPRFALIWQLKGFFYSYGKVMAAGAKREASARLDGVKEGDVPALAAMGGAASIFAIMGIATLPLAMAGMELREYAKYGLAYVLPGFSPDDKNYFRTDDMSWSRYLGAAFDRSYAFGPLTIGKQMMQASDWGRGPMGAISVGLGPTAETAVRMMEDGPSSTFRNRISPTGLL